MQRDIEFDTNEANFRVIVYMECMATKTIFHNMFHDLTMVKFMLMLDAVEFHVQQKQRKNYTHPSIFVYFQMLFEMLRLLTAIECSILYRRTRARLSHNTHHTHTRHAIFGVRIAD